MSRISHKKSSALQLLGESDLTAQGWNSLAQGDLEQSHQNRCWAWALQWTHPQIPAERGGGLCPFRWVLSALFPGSPSVLLSPWSWGEGHIFIITLVGLGARMEEASQLGFCHFCHLSGPSWLWVFVSWVKEPRAFIPCIKLPSIGWETSLGDTLLQGH